MDNEAATAYARAIVTQNSCHLFAIAFLYWDHLITLDAEIRYLWRRPKSSGAFLFFGVRYGALLGNIPVTVFSFVNLSPPGFARSLRFTLPQLIISRCLLYGLMHEIFQVSIQVLVSAIMVQRMYALYSGDKRILWSLIATMTLLMVIILWLVQNEHSYFMVPVLSGCHPTMPRESSYHMAGAWGALFVFDTIIFALTIFNAYATRRKMGLGAHTDTGTCMPMHALIIRDGAMYFAAMALANLANITTFVIAGSLPLIPGTLATFATCISATMASRLVLNIHKQVDVNKGDDGDAEGNVPGRNLSIPGLRIHDYLHLLSISPLYWDYLITLDSEVGIVWKRARSASACWFFLVRYAGLVGNLPVTVFTFYTIPVKWFARLHFDAPREKLKSFPQLIVSIVMLIRIHALYGRNLRFLAGFLAMSLPLLAVIVWSVQSQGQRSDTVLGFPGCHTSSPQPSNYHLAAAWEGLFAYDCLVFGLTVFKTFSTWRRTGSEADHLPIHTLILRDGALYFAAMAMANLGNIITFYPILSGSLSTFASCMSVTLMARLMLNLHKTSEAGAHIDFDWNSAVVFDDRRVYSDVVFASECDAEPPADIDPETQRSYVPP
ncbi:hypothetical protein B0H11DRAFT_2316078 [Mycena galericulata]|nr:hypothetical protein B0H11DRAFT_2316078 [Mycena galericulata]